MVSKKTLLLLLFISFLALSYFVKNYPVNSFDFIISTIIQGINFPLFDSLMKDVTLLGNFYPALASVFLAAVIFLILGKPKFALLIFISVSVAGNLSTIFKTLISRPRPDPALVRQAENLFSNDSFPSGHVLYAVGFYGLLFVLAKIYMKKGYLRTLLLIIFSVLVILMAVSRIYLGAHWFSDVLGSYLLGGIWLFLIILIANRIKL